MISRIVFNRIVAISITFGLLGIIVFPAAAEQATEGSGALKSFVSPDEAARKLVEVVSQEDNKNAIAEFFGPKYEDILSSGDEVEDKSNREQFLALAKEKIAVENTGDSQASLLFGEKDWVFPIPLVKKDGQWSFDPAAGTQEIQDRRIGLNELSTIGVVQSYVEAQFDYASVDRNGDDVSEYAQKLLSDPGTNDGLYWESEPGQPESPFGPLVAEARVEGYQFKKKSADERTPYHGYFFKILTGQGAAATGGKYDYIINGHMIAGFALVAFPAKYGSSGIMTFIVNHQGKIYQKDMGPKTAELASAMKRYDPDSSWELVDMKSMP